jgi:3' exoribonuclease, RNase T-like
MTVIAYDEEFLEDGKTIALISIGMVRDDGAEYYAVNKDASKWRLRRRIRKHAWLMANVVPSLPKAHGDARLYQPNRWLFNYSDPCVKYRDQIANDVHRFIAGTPKPQLWADYAAYDHVVLAQLFGRMIDLPGVVPMRTNDLRQEWERLGSPDLPPMRGEMPGMGEHNALFDAREVLYRLRWLRDYGPEGRGVVAGSGGGAGGSTTFIPGGGSGGLRISQTATGGGVAGVAAGTGLDRAAEAVRRARGGRDAPPQIQGYA